MFQREADAQLEAQDQRAWYPEMFAPSVAAGLCEHRIAGYRNG